MRSDIADDQQSLLTSQRGPVRFMIMSTAVRSSMGELNVSIHKSAMRRAATPGPLLARVIRPWRSDKKCASFAERFVEGVRTSDASRRDVSHAGISFAHLNFAMSVASRGLAFIAPGALR